MPREESNSKQSIANNEVVEPNVFLETEKTHKDWYDANQMGRQDGRPRRVPREIAKPKGVRKHSLRKEK